MKLLKKRIILIVFIFFSIAPLNLMSQSQGVVADIQTRLPIAYVNIYTQKGENTLGAMSNDKGHFSIAFPFQSLSFSHINYERKEVLKANLSDTLFLTPTSVILSEITIRNKEPRWISRILNEVVKQKNKNYRASPKQPTYQYETSTLTDSTGYAFASNGVLQMPVRLDNTNYFIDAQHNVIRYKDKTAGVDFTNLKTMLYVDFMSYFDPKFLRNNVFTQNGLYKPSNRLLVQLMFHENNRDGNHGYIVVDTLHKVIVESEHVTDTEYNFKNNTTLFYKVFAPRLGMKYDVWVTRNHATYSRWGGSYYLSESTYKFSRKKSVKNKQRESHTFTSSEARLTMSDGGTALKTKWIPLQKPYYLLTIRTKQMQREEAALDKVQVVYEGFK